MRPVLRLLALASAALAGCGSPRPELAPSARTGAEEAARAFFTALKQRDWQTAYDALDPVSQASCSKEQFAARGERHLKQMGFAPTEVYLSVHESADSATANAMFRAGSKQFRDGAALRRTDAGWRVVLPKNFGG